MIKFRTGPHMGIPYDQARAIGLSSALKGEALYTEYVTAVRVTKPSERLLGHKADYLIVDDLEPRPTVTLSGLFPATQLPDHWGQGDYIVGLMKACAESFKSPKEWTQPVPFDVLKPTRKEKPE